MSNVSSLTNSLLTSLYAKSTASVAAGETEASSASAAKATESGQTDTVTLSGQSLDLLKTLLESGSSGSATASSSADQTLALLQTLFGASGSSSTASASSEDPTLALLQTLFGSGGTGSATSGTAAGGSGDLMVGVLNEALNKKLLGSNPTLASIFQSSDATGTVDLVHMSAEDIMSKIESYQKSQNAAAEGSPETDVTA